MEHLSQTSGRQPAVSVIVPVYKAEKYLHRCVDSLLAQTFTDFELILIDDGSPDSSGEICDAYAARDERVRVIHQTNGGVSAARQKGIDEAQGEYTIHADPDDWVEPTMLEELYRKAKEEDADIVICDYITHIRKKKIYTTQRPSALNSDALVHDLLFQQLHGSCCNKLVKRACYSLYGVRFPEGLNMREDLHVCLSLLMHPVKAAYLNKAFYHYDLATNGNSLSLSGDRRKKLANTQRFNAYWGGYLNNLKYKDGWLNLQKMEAYDVLCVGCLNAREYKQRYGHLLHVPTSHWGGKYVDKALSGHYTSARLYVKFRNLLRELKRFCILRL